MRFDMSQGATWHIGRHKGKCLNVNKKKKKLKIC